MTTGAPPELEFRVYKGRLLVGLQIVPGTRTVRCYEIPLARGDASIVSTLPLTEIAPLAWEEYRALPLAQYVLVAIAR